MGTLTMGSKHGPHRICHSFDVLFERKESSENESKNFGPYNWHNMQMSFTEMGKTWQRSSEVWKTK